MYIYIFSAKGDVGKRSKLLRSSALKKNKAVNQC